MRTGRLLTAVGAALVLLVALVVVLRGSDSPLVPRSEECTVTADGRTVDLDRATAERASATVAARGSLGNTADDRAVTSSLTGATPHSLSCAYDGSVAEASPRLLASGLTGRAGGVRRDVERVFGPQQLGGFAPGGVESGHMPGSAHYEGRAVDVFFRPVNGGNRQRGWALAHYLVAHAVRLDVATVIFDGRIWSRWRSDEGWRDYSPDVSGRPRATAAILEHRDHVHVDVAP